MDHRDHMRTSNELLYRLSAKYPDVCAYNLLDTCIIPAI